MSGGTAELRVGTPEEGFFYLFEEHTLKPVTEIW